MTNERPVGTHGEALLRRAADAAGVIMIDWGVNADVCAARRLVRRGLMYKQHFGRSGRPSVFHVITDAGRAMLDRLKEEREC